MEKEGRIAIQQEIKEETVGANKRTKDTERKKRYAIT